MVEAHKKSSTRDTVESLLVTVILAIFGTTFILQADRANYRRRPASGRG